MLATSPLTVESKHKSAPMRADPSFVAAGAPSRGVPLRPAGDPEQKNAEARTAPTWGSAFMKPAISASTGRLKADRPRPPGTLSQLDQASVGSRITCRGRRWTPSLRLAPRRKASLTQCLDPRTKSQLARMPRACTYAPEHARAGARAGKDSGRGPRSPCRFVARGGLRLALPLSAGAGAAVTCRPFAGHPAPPRELAVQSVSRRAADRRR